MAVAYRPRWTTDGGPIGRPRLAAQELCIGDVRLGRQLPDRAGSPNATFDKIWE